MLSSEEHPGVFAFLVGMIVLVMAGVGLSLMVDRHFKFSRGAGEVQSELDSGASEITDLTDRNEAGSHFLSEGAAKLRPLLKAHKDLSTQLETQRQHQAALEKSQIRIRESITALEEDFSRYRAEYRRKTWLAAIGESLGNLTIRGGRVFQQAAITRVTDVGLEIRHEHGIARIQAPDLDLKMQDRFQWSDEERRSRLEEERENREGKLVKETVDEPAVIGNAVAEEQSPEPPVPPVSRIQNVRPAQDDGKLKLLRFQVSGWQAKVSKLRNDRMEASSRAGYGNQTSVPGSLETWVARSSRLGQELLNAQANLAVAKANLAAVSPADPLLRPEPDH